MFDRTVAPQHQVISDVNFQHVTSQVLSAHTPFHYLISGRQPVVKIEILFPRAGTWYEHKSGVALLSLKTLREGTGSFSSEQISEYLSGHGAFFDIHPGFDYASLSLHCLDKHVKDLLPLFMEIINEPEFVPSEVEFQKKLQKSQVQLQNKRNNIRASRKLRRELFGELHPYGRVMNEKDVEQVSAEDLRYFHSQQMQDVEVFVSGAPSESSFELIKSHFDHRAFSHYDQAVTCSKGHEAILQPNKAEQSSIRLGKEVIKKGHKDYIPLLITNHLLGGFFGSRLMKNIREDKGLTYGINSSLANLTHSSYWVLGAEVNERLTDQALSEIRKEIDLLREFDREDELDVVKTHMIGSFQSDVNSPHQLMGKFKNVHLHGLDYDYYRRYFSCINDFTCADVREMASKYLAIHDIKEVVVK
ncbi:insulinase family protein [Fulvivirga sp. M361]|uniref:M16 family metallopeptidase n=1 Tax=Fulvivirga sp. M361 TaxID=2594266 RepID=UPI00117A0C03|nr:pitrilysin family protein [Fulvivirga sp. M361]TRX61238.1 insulinase family protein [Fulvivirga sp. M361]